MTDLSGKSAIVTGGLTGMGLAIAAALAVAGANVAVGSRSVKNADDPRYKTELDGLRATGQKVYAGYLDVTDQASVDTFMAGARGHWVDRHLDQCRRYHWRAARVWS